MRGLIRGFVVAIFIGSATASAISDQPRGPVAQGGAGNTGIGLAQSQLYSLSDNVAYTAHAEDIPSGIGALRRLRDGTEVSVSQKMVTSVFGIVFYVEEVDRSAAIRVVCQAQDPIPQANSIVSFTGAIETVGYEREIRPTSPIRVDIPGAPAAIPVMMMQRFIGGGPMDPYTPGMPDLNELLPDGTRASYINTVGVKIRTYGQVITTNQFDSRGDYFYIDDGCKIKDGSWSYADPNLKYRGVRVYSRTLPPANTLQKVTGISDILIFDPTPSLPDSGDEIPIRAVMCPGDSDVTPLLDQTPGQGSELGSATGLVRLTDNPSTPVAIRVYSTYEMAFIREGSGAYHPFSLTHILSGGSVVTATAPGYFSQTKVLAPGDTNITFDLIPAGHVIEASFDRPTVGACSSETSRLSVLYRDAEGKWLANRNLHVTTTIGTFAETGQAIADVTTDENGTANLTFRAAPDGPGTARINVVDALQTSISCQTTIIVAGPNLKIRSWPEGLGPGNNTAIVTATITDRAQPLSDVELVFATDWGHFVESSSGVARVRTAANGTASVTIAIDQPGTARIVVRYTSPCGDDSVDWDCVNYGAAPWIQCSTRTSSPLVADLTGSGDGKKDVALVTTDGLLQVWDSNGSLLWSRPAFSSGNNTPSCADIDLDGSLEVVLPSENETSVYAYSGAAGLLEAGWPIKSDYPFIGVSAAVGDVNADGAPEVVAGDESCYVFAWNGTGNWEKSSLPSSSFLWRNLTGSAGVAITGSSCAIGDIAGRLGGVPEVVVGTNDVVQVYAFPGDAWGDHIAPPVYVPGWPKATSMWVECSPAIGDVDGDGRNDVAVGCDGGSLYIYRSATSTWTAFAVDGSIRSAPALADLNGDGKLDIIFGDDGGRVHALTGDGSPVLGWEGGILLNGSNPSPVTGSPVVGDVNGDGKIEVLAGSVDGYLYCLYDDGLNHKGQDGHATGPIDWVKRCAPAISDAGILSSPVICDLDGDGKIDIIVSGTAGIYRFALDAPYVGTAQAMPWPMFMGNNARTGCASPPAPAVYASIVGRITRAGAPEENDQVYITHADGTDVYVPHSSPPIVRPPVNTVGSPGVVEHNKGGYSINQLDPNTSYTIRVVSPGYADKIISDVNVTTGVTRLDVEM